MLKRFANILHRVANLFDRPKPVELVTPLEFITTEVLAGEIRSRSDVCVIMHGRIQRVGNIPGVIGDVYYRLSEEQVDDVITMIRCALQQPGRPND